MSIPDKKDARAEVRLERDDNSMEGYQTMG
jgi:hypothetical protein